MIPFTSIIFPIGSSSPIKPSAGYVGLLAGVGLIELISWAMDNFGIKPEFFSNPQVDIKTAAAATLLLVFAGTLAGFFPARKAAKVSPIEALKDE